MKKAVLGKGLVVACIFSVAGCSELQVSNKLSAEFNSSFPGLKECGVSELEIKPYADGTFLFNFYRYEISEARVLVGHDNDSADGSVLAIKLDMPFQRIKPVQEIEIERSKSIKHDPWVIKIPNQVEWEVPYGTVKNVIWKAARAVTKMCAISKNWKEDEIQQE